MPRLRSKKVEDVSLLASFLADEKHETSAEDIANTTEMFFHPIPGGFLVPLERIETWDRQPRKTFDEQSINELASSIAEAGLIEPLVVRRDMDRPGYYIIIAGHRRLLAARRVFGHQDPEIRARVETLPCIVREATEAMAFADALVENLVRKDLTRKEVMDAILALQDEYHWSLREIARRTGRNPGDLSVLLRVARDPELSALVAEEIIAATTAGHLTGVDRALRAQIITRVHSGELRTGADVQGAIDVAQAGGVFDIKHPVASPEPATTQQTNAVGPPDATTKIDETVHVLVSNLPVTSNGTLSEQDVDALTASPGLVGPAPADYEATILVTEHMRRKSGGTAGRLATIQIHAEVEDIVGDIAMFVARARSLDAADAHLLTEAGHRLMAYARARGTAQV